MIKKLSSKYSEKLLHYARQSTMDALKPASRWAIQKTAEAVGDLIGNKIANIITKVSKHLKQNNLETVTNEHDKEITKERYISLEEKQKINDDLWLIL